MILNEMIQQADLHFFRVEKTLRCATTRVSRAQPHWLEKQTVFHRVTDTLHWLDFAHRIASSVHSKHRQVSFIPSGSS